MPVTIETIREAQERISPYSLRTPCLRLNSLDEFLGCQVYVKAECMQITGAFKLRGALNKLLSLPREQLQGAGAGESGACSGQRSNLTSEKFTFRKSFSCLGSVLA